MVLVTFYIKLFLNIVLQRWQTISLQHSYESLVTIFAFKGIDVQNNAIFSYKDNDISDCIERAWLKSINIEMIKFY